MWSLIAHFQRQIGHCGCLKSPGGRWPWGTCPEPPPRARQLELRGKKTNLHEHNLPLSGGRSTLRQVLPLLSTLETAATLAAWLGGSVVMPRPSWALCVAHSGWVSLHGAEGGCRAIIQSHFGLPVCFCTLLHQLSASLIDLLLPICPGLSKT